MKRGRKVRVRERDMGERESRRRETWNEVRWGGGGVEREETERARDRQTDR